MYDYWLKYHDDISIHPPLNYTVGPYTFKSNTIGNVMNTIEHTNKKLINPLMMEPLNSYRLVYS